MKERKKKIEPRRRAKKSNSASSFSPAARRRRLFFRMLRFDFPRSFSRSWLFATLSPPHRGQACRSLLAASGSNRGSWRERTSQNNLKRGSARFFIAVLASSPPCRGAWSLKKKKKRSPRTPTVDELLLFHTGAPELVVQ